MEARDGHRVLWSAAGALAVVTLPVWYVTPTTGLDPSWQVALHLLAQGQAGDARVAFTYGPLGALSAPMDLSDGWYLSALVWTLGVHVALTVGVLTLLRRWMPDVAALAATAVVVITATGAPEVPAAAFVWAATAVQRPRERPVGWWWVPVTGALAGIALLVKVNDGLLAMALLAVAAWFARPRGPWALSAFGGTVATTVVTTWVLLGRDLGDGVVWVRDSLDITRGYSEAMVFEATSTGWQYLVGAAVLAVSALLVWRAATGLPGDRRVAFLLCTAVAVFGGFKHGFVRHDAGHAVSAFAALLLAVVAAPWGRVRAAVGAGLLVATAAAVALVQLSSPSTAFRLDPVARAGTLATGVRMLGDSEARHVARTEAQRRMRETLAIPVSMLARVGDDPVHVLPYEVSAVWAHGLTWRPLPVFQDYSLYTASLDRLNADALRGPDGPAWLLYRDEPRIDERAPQTEGPRQFLGLLCGFREVESGDGWHLLRRDAWRCGAERDLGSAALRPGEGVPLPATGPGEITIARVEWSAGLGEQLRTVLFRGSPVPRVVVPGSLDASVPPGVLAEGVVVAQPAGTLAVPARRAAATLRVDGLRGDTTVRFAAVTLR